MKKRWAIRRTIRRSTIRLCRWAVVVRCRGGLPCPDKATGDRRQATRRQDRQLEATSKWSSGSRLLPEATIAITPPTPPTPPHTTHTTHNTTHQAGPEKATQDGACLAEEFCLHRTHGVASSSKTYMQPDKVTVTDARHPAGRPDETVQRPWPDSTSAGGTRTSHQISLLAGASVLPCFRASGLPCFP